MRNPRESERPHFIPLLFHFSFSYLQRPWRRSLHHFPFLGPSSLKSYTTSSSTNPRSVAYDSPALVFPFLLEEIDFIILERQYYSVDFIHWDRNPLSSWLASHPFLSMGAGLSGLAEDSNGCRHCLSTTLSDVPEGCISAILANLDPPEICNLARVNRAFFSASLADFVWESKLPANYEFLVKKVLGEDPETLPKKEIYARLCLPTCFDGGTKVHITLWYFV